MDPSSRSDMKRALPFAAALVCLVYNALTVMLCIHLPNDPFHMASGVYLYACAGCVFSVLGAIGVAKKQTTLVRTFAQFLLIDAFLSVICRMLLEEFFIETLYESNVCGDAFGDDEWSTLNPGYAVVMDSRWQNGFKDLFDSPRSCNLALVGLHFVAVAALVLTSAAQVSLAIVMQRFGRQLERSQQLTSWQDHADEKLPLSSEYSDELHA